jgi:folate-dependent phosphoribosylglycinamide formyltransferase PurN
MRVVVVTGEKPHHKQLCVALAAKHDVVGIIHPTRPRVANRHRLRNRIQRHGLNFTALTLAAKGPGWFCGWDADAEMATAAQHFFPEAASEFNSLPATLIHRDVDVSVDGPALLRGLRPDVVVVLGGPVYPVEFIDAAPLFLNFHSGISPLYNGAASVQFAFANRHPHLCGGTLMTMSRVVDGGAVLGHFLPSVESGDTPSKLFMRTAAGATLLYGRLLDHLADGSSFVSAPQAAPLFYYRGIDWTIYHSLTTRLNVRRNVAGDHRREMEMCEYWRLATDRAAADALDSTIHRLLWDVSS